MEETTNNINQETSTTAQVAKAPEALVVSFRSTSAARPGDKIFKAIIDNREDTIAVNEDELRLAQQKAIGLIQFVPENT